jgi:hypothetical protein
MIAPAFWSAGRVSGADGFGDDRRGIAAKRLARIAACAPYRFAATWHKRIQRRNQYQYREDRGARGAPAAVASAAVAGGNAEHPSADVPEAGGIVNVARKHFQTEGEWT